MIQRRQVLKFLALNVFTPFWVQSLTKRAFAQVQKNSDLSKSLTEIKKIKLLNFHQFETVSEIGEIIIPTTDIGGYLLKFYRVKFLKSWK